MTRPRLVRVLLCAALPVVPVLPALRAQESRLVHEVEGRPSCSLRTLACCGGAATGGVGFLRVELENLESNEREVRVEIGTGRLSPGDVKVFRVFRLAAMERAVSFLPLPTPFPPSTLQFTVDGVEQTSAGGLRQADGLAGLLVSDRPDAEPAGLALLQAMPSRFSTAPQQSVVGTASAPLDWRLYSGFHVVHVDGRGQVGADLQETLRRVAFAGGTVVVSAPASLPAGPLRSLGQGARLGGPQRHGLGVIAALWASDEAGMSRQLAGFDELGAGPLPVAPALQYEAPIPGLGEAPVRVFLSVIVLFALLAGPVNFVLLRRWRQPLLALVTVPALGFGTTLLILGYGFLYDGFGVRGVETSWTFLDQGRHEAAMVCTRTLFAGQAPGAIPLASDSLLLAPRATRSNERAADRWRHDVGAATLDGGLLPSRTPTPLVTVQQGVVRQRLTARRDSDVLQLLTDGGVAPIGDVVLRDFDGNYWLGPAPNLRAVIGEVALQAVAKMRAGGESLIRLVPQREEWRRGRFRDLGVELESVPVGLLGTRMLPTEALALGSYVAEVAAPAWLDRHGLEAALDESRHFVHGRMSEEDFVR